MELYKNMVYEWTNVPAPNSIERLLWLDSADPYVWTISVYNPKAQPLPRTRAELEVSFRAGEVRVLAKDPYAHLVRREEDIKATHRVHRDKAWELVSELLQDSNSRVLQFYARKSSVIALAKKKACGKWSLYRLLRCYYQRGQIKNAFLPLYDNCGWRGRLYPEKGAEKKPQKENPETKSSGVPVFYRQPQVFQGASMLLGKHSNSLVSGSACFTTHVKSGRS